MEHQSDSGSPEATPATNLKRRHPKNDFTLSPGRKSTDEDCSSSPEVYRSESKLVQNNRAKSVAPRVSQSAFIHKLYSMLEDPNSNHLITWSSTYDSFVVTPGKEFSRVLSQYFKHTNVSSFVRQLNMYGFHKVNDTYSTSLNSGANQNSYYKHYHPQNNSRYDNPQNPPSRGVQDTERPGGLIMATNISIAQWEFKHGSNCFKRGDFESLGLIKRRTSRMIHTTQALVYDSNLNNTDKDIVLKHGSSISGRNDLSSLSSSGVNFGHEISGSTNWGQSRSGPTETPYNPFMAPRKISTGTPTPTITSQRTPSIAPVIQEAPARTGAAITDLYPGETEDTQKRTSSRGAYFEENSSIDGQNMDFCDDKAYLNLHEARLNRLERSLWHLQDHNTRLNQVYISVSDHVRKLYGDVSQVVDLMGQFTNQTRADDHEDRMNVTSLLSPRHDTNDDSQTDTSRPRRDSSSTQIKREVFKLQNSLHQRSSVLNQIHANHLETVSLQQQQAKQQNEEKMVLQKEAQLRQEECILKKQQQQHLQEQELQLQQLQQLQQQQRLQNVQPLHNLPNLQSSAHFAIPSPLLYGGGLPTPLPMGQYSGLTGSMPMAIPTRLGESTGYYNYGGSLAVPVSEEGSDSSANPARAHTTSTVPTTIPATIPATKPATITEEYPRRELALDKPDNKDGAVVGSKGASGSNESRDFSGAVRCTTELESTVTGTPARPGFETATPPTVLAGPMVSDSLMVTASDPIPTKRSRASKERSTWSVQALLNDK
ncbi:hypothetical protein NADFUDRAFT_50485 [Nadsonia fulvescens var. elongata DSM 6958]|uniref:Heat shock transcription factor n=1 Tax=Nadsonia fulvescens var. elongata DSM 6958 TaxID=857566 RepID=A0A1E3PMB8_9ASCO|nr:hypothetical protein NADFUDRAFT_50485 [Nadsonia fulvescens var. elongata DSM 6958]